MNSSLSRAHRAAGGVSCVLWLFLVGCSTGSPSGSPQLKLPAVPTQARDALTGAGAIAGTASFDAVFVDPAAWTGTPIGTGSFSLSVSPAIAGGPSAVAAVDASSGTAYHYALIADFYAANGQGLAVISDAPWALGATAIDRVHTFVVAFDLATGDPIAEATNGTVTLTATGSALGDHLAGTFTGDFALASAPPPGMCRSDADCASGQSCVSGSCVSAPAGCTSNAQCGAGLVCQNGTCTRTAPVSCVGLQGPGGYSGGWGGLATCSAAGTGTASLTNGIAFIDEDQGQLALTVADPNTGSDGVVIALTACPSGPGSVTLNAGDAALYVSRPGAAADTDLFLRKTASAGTVTFNATPAGLAGSFSLSFAGGGTLTGTFQVQ